MLRSSVVTALLAVAPLSALAQAPSEAKDEGLKVIEINVGAEFHGLMETTDVDIAGEILDYVVQKARGTAPIEW